MQVSLCFVCSLLLVFAGVSMTNGEALGYNGFIKNLVKRAAPDLCGYDGDSCAYRQCCNGYTCSYETCIRDNNYGMVKRSISGCSTVSCEYNSCCNGYDCQYGECIRASYGNRGKRSISGCSTVSCDYNPCCNGYDCQYGECIRASYGK